MKNSNRNNNIFPKELTMSQSPFRIVIIIAFLILVSEAFVMIIIHFLQISSVVFTVIFDSTFLVVLLSPAFYFFIFNPLVRHNAELEQSKVKLKATNQQLIAGEQQLKAINQQLVANEKELRNSEYQLKESQKIARLGSYVLDIASDIWKSSSILDNIFGLVKKYKKDVAGWLQIVHPEDKAMMQDYFAKNVLINHEPFDKEYRIKKINDQQERWVHGMGILEINDDGDPIKMSGTIQDITERKKVEEKLKSRNKELETWAEVTTDKELKMIELKKEINELLDKSGEKPKYEIPT